MSKIAIPQISKQELLDAILDRSDAIECLQARTYRETNLPKRLNERRTGQAVAAFVTLKKGDWNHDELAEELRKWVGREIGSFAKPAQIRFTDSLPKTRSGKIMRRLLREIVTNNVVAGDVTTLEDLSVLTKLAAQHEDDA